MSHDHQRRNPLLWEDEEQATGVFVGTDDGLSLIGLPDGLKAKSRPSLPAGYVPTSALVNFVAAIRAALMAHDGVSPATVLPLSTLEPMDRHAVADILGDGEVSIVAGQDPLYQVQESVLTGVWRVRAESADGHVVSETIEVGDVPRIVRDAAGRYGRPMANVAALALDASVMNAPAILAEIAERAAMWRPGTLNHVINFTLLPLTPADTDAITTVLGQVPLTIVSGGYGTCRIMATNVRNVWAVQYLNANGAIILDTVEIGDVPEAARAAQVDFEDSAVRLGEIMEAYLT